MAKEPAPPKPSPPSGSPKKAIAKFGMDKMLAVVEGYDKQLDSFTAFLNEDQTTEAANSLAVMDKTMKLMKEMPDLIKKRDSIAAMANGDEAPEGPADDTERSAVQRKHAQ